MYHKRINLFFKRLLDILGSSIGIIILAPVFVIISLAIRSDSKGAIFFRQDRLGKNGKKFRILKFRTMIENAEKIGDGLTINSSEDNRITKIGSLLRKTSLDELPQLFNVLSGEMSLVGPRPPVTYFPYDGYQSYPTWAKKRFEMKPGVTGLAQVRVRNSVPWDERIKIDNEYIEKFDFLIDVKIIFLTVKKIFKQENIY